MKVRINRLLWSYEASRVETEHDQELRLSCKASKPEAEGVIRALDL